MSVDKLKIIPLEQLILKRERVRRQVLEFNAAARLQNWWREKVSSQKRPFKLGIWELVKMLDKVLRI